MTAVAEEITYKFDAALKRGTKRLKEINLRRPKAGELKGLSISSLQNGDISSVLKLLPRISNPALTNEECEELDLADMNGLSTEIVLFFGKKEVRERLK